jgi:hypothetical protein
MNMLKKLVCVGALLGTTLVGYAAAPVLDGGWASDSISAAATDSLSSPYVYNLSGGAVFSITDDFVTGDQYKVYDFGVLILTTTAASAIAGQPYGGGVGGPGYQWGSVSLSAGAHSLTVQGDGAGGIPAGFYTRLDSVPDSGNLAALLGLVFAGLMVAARRKL